MITNPDGSYRKQKPWSDEWILERAKIRGEKERKNDETRPPRDACVCWSAIRITLRVHDFTKGMRVSLPDWNLRSDDSAADRV